MLPRLHSTASLCLALAFVTVPLSQAKPEPSKTPAFAGRWEGQYKTESGGGSLQRKK